MGEIFDNVRSVLERVREAARRSGRDPSEVTVVAVSKTHGVEKILEAAEAGISTFGENYVQEAEKKILSVGQPLKWHLVGHLQKNKAKKAVTLFDYIETVDSVKIAQEISTRALSVGKKVPVLVQVNVAEESSKWGVLRNDLVPLLEEIALLPGIEVKGLMTIPPYEEDPEEARKYFASLRELKEKVNGLGIPGIELKELSMGMSHDFEVAIEEGATIIRVGTAIFGRRHYA
ncbi:MAG: YggS family pyridoxal phosphate-dependent enzyme [Deltaproteobacteria bacterium]|nr:MAG: YggS family pyridoxal phosphate-dependent enzyme [Deltaproteobacteria bacterium]